MSEGGDMTTDQRHSPVAFPLPRRMEAAEKLRAYVLSLSEEQQPVSQTVLAATALAETTPPEPAAFVARLNDLRVEKQLSYDRLGRRAQRHRRLRLSRSGIYKMLHNTRLPSHLQLVGYLALCEVSLREQNMWLDLYRQAWAPYDCPVLQPAIPTGNARPSGKTAPRKPKHQQPGQRTSVNWRRPRRPPLHRRYLEAHAVYALAGSTLVVALTAVVLSVLDVPSWFITLTLIGTAAGVTGWTLRRVAPPPIGHRNAYAHAYDSYDDFDYFDPDQLVVPPVLGS